MAIDFLHSSIINARIDGMEGENEKRTIRMDEQQKYKDYVYQSIYLMDFHTYQLNQYQRYFFIELNVNALVLFGEKWNLNQITCSFKWTFRTLFYSLCIQTQYMLDLSEVNINIDCMRFEMSEAIAEPVIVCFLLPMISTPFFP